jgi:hypothetical protein
MLLKPLMDRVLIAPAPRREDTAASQKKDPKYMIGYQPHY